MASRTREWFCRNVRTRRLHLGMTQVEFAEMLDVSQPGVSDIENDRYSVGLDMVDRIAVALETTSEALLRDPAAFNCQ